MHGIAEHRIRLLGLRRGIPLDAAQLLASPSRSASPQSAILQCEGLRPVASTHGAGPRATLRSGPRNGRLRCTGPGAGPVASSTRGGRARVQEFAMLRSTDKAPLAPSGEARVHRAVAHRLAGTQARSSGGWTAVSTSSRTRDRCASATAGGIRRRRTQRAQQHDHQPEAFGGSPSAGRPRAALIHVDAAPQSRTLGNGDAKAAEVQAGQGRRNAAATTPARCPAHRPAPERSGGCASPTARGRRTGRSSRRSPQQRPEHGSQLHLGLGEFGCRPRQGHDARPGPCGELLARFRAERKATANYPSPFDCW